jgi:hypothetical protein
MFYRTKSRINTLIRKLPVVKSYFMKMRFKVELDVIKGKHHTDSTHPSIIHFSVNKAATQYIKSIFYRSAKENGMTPVDIHHYAFLSDFPFLDKLSASQMQEYQHIFKPAGYFYGVFGGMIETISNLEKY